MKLKILIAFFCGLTSTATFAKSMSEISFGLALANTKACKFAMYGSKDSINVDPISEALDSIKNIDTGIFVANAYEIYETIMKKYTNDGVFTKGNSFVVTEEWCQQEADALIKKYGTFWSKLTR